jgi:putative acetyltransferase
MRIIVNDRLHLSEFHPSDRPALVEYLNDRAIYDQTLRIPFPYTEADADQFLTRNARTTLEQGQPLAWAIREESGRLIGGLGYDKLVLGQSHHAELGYWLARPFWGRGIMTAVVDKVCAWGFQQFGLVKIIAHVYPGNTGSIRVLEKCGFQAEGHLHKHFLKDGRLIDARLFARFEGKDREAIHFVAVQTEDPAKTDVRPLIELLDQYLTGLYPAESNHLLPVESLREPNVTFLTARVEGQIAGCGAFVNLDGAYAEIKRVFVRPAFRGARVGRRILAELERRARLAGLPLARLETGVLQPEALALFEKAGYQRRGPFGTYPDDPLCVFMEKPLT